MTTITEVLKRKPVFLIVIKNNAITGIKRLLMAIQEGEKGGVLIVSDIIY